MIKFRISGDHKKSRDWLLKNSRGEIFKELNRYGQMGVDALATATPVESGLAARSWGYRIIKGRRGPVIQWYNTNRENGASVVILIQYGHGTGTGGYVQGRDFINPAIRPIFDRIANDVWKKVTSG